ncbi:MAG: NAD(P)/FAD-dependent oxidoreductase [Lachnospiraceae bacterium]|nr:NAD(P)/FAD-dependent oxidoreductase [Lachnospiraceae bacterium]
MKKVIVIGGGPAGMFAALAAAEKGHSVILIEKNEKLGKKLYITGKGRCNLTNAGDMDTLFSNVITNRKFLYSAFYAYDNFRVIDFFENHGVKTKTERGNRVFPVSDHASDIIHALSRALEQAGVKVRLYTRAEGILTEEGHCTGICLSGGTVEDADAVILATGGFSYQSTGSTGDGYRFAEECGHNITEIEPSLVPFTTKEAYILQLQGLSLKNVRVTIKQGKKTLFEEFGEMLFTHFGVSGPLILSASSIVGKKLKKQELFMSIDLKPALSAEQLDRRLLRDFEENRNRQFKNAVQGLLPSKLLPVLIELSGISPEKKVNELTREERSRLTALLKAFPVTLVGMRGFHEAIITRGGVSVKEVNPSTMESKLVSDLYFAGEVLDLDAMTGGFNLQIAWSTGYLAGSSV